MSLVALQSALRTFETTEPRAAHRRLGGQLLAATGADFALSFTLHEHSGGTHYADLTVVGASDVEQFTDTLDGGPTPWLPWRAEQPRATDVNVFKEVVEAIHPEVLERLSLWHDLYLPFGINQKLRALVYDGDQFAHYISVGSRDGRRISARDCARLSALADEVVAVTRTIDRLRSSRANESVPLDACYVQFRGDGRREFATPDAQRLLDNDPMMRESLATRVRAIDRRNDPRGWSISGSCACEIVRMDGAEGVRYLVVWHPLTRPQRSAASELTGRQRDVAEYAASGATVDEIAATMSISPNTVKSHLKRVYDTLQVSNRVELAELLSSHAR